MPFGVIFAWDARRHAPAPSLINANRPSCRVCRLQRRRSALEAPCPLVCLVCRPGGRPTFSCDPEAHAVRERPSSASAHAPGGASLYNGKMARLMGLSSAGMCLCWGGLRPSCERAAQPAHSQVRRKRTPRPVAFGYVWRATLEYRRMVSSQAHYPSTRPRC